MELICNMHELTKSRKRITSSFLTGAEINAFDLIKNPIYITLFEGIRRDRTINKLQDRLSNLVSYDQKNLLTREETANILDISLRKLDQLKADGKIAPTKVGRLVKFQKKEIIRFIKKNTDYEDSYKL